MHTQDLIDRLAAKDASALDEFYRRYRLLILAIARGVVRDEWDAEEVLQDVLWTAWRKADTLREDTNLKAWVARVARNASLMLLRKRRRVPRPIDGAIVEATLSAESLDDHSVRPDRIAASRQALRGVAESLTGLDAMNAELFIAMDVFGEERDDVAERLGLSVGALKSRLHRARMAVRERTDDPSYFA